MLLDAQDDGRIAPVSSAATARAHRVATIQGSASARRRVKSSLPAAFGRLFYHTMPKHETKEQGAIRRQTASNMRKSSTFFAEADKDANQNIDFEEFYAMQPRAICKAYSVEDIKTWFDSADTNGGHGSLSIDEFFLWSLGNAAVKHGSMSLTAAFEKYDKDGSGSLDAIEFGKACTEMGYGVEAYSIFQSLDEDGSGTICYREMLAKIEEGSMKVAPQAKQMLTALSKGGRQGREGRDHRID